MRLYPATRLFGQLCGNVKCLCWHVAVVSWSIAMNKRIVLRFVPLAAAALLGCRREQASRACVDSNGIVVNPQHCADHGGDYGGNGTTGGHGSGGGFYPYYWYYYQGRVPLVIGGRAPAGGSYYAPPGGNFGGRSGTTGTVTRGGFGSTASGHSSGGGE